MQQSLLVQELHGMHYLQCHCHYLLCGQDPCNTLSRQLAGLQEPAVRVWNYSSTTSVTLCEMIEASSGTKPPASYYILLYNVNSDHAS
jgi:hypothetical protein